MAQAQGDAVPRGRELGLVEADGAVVVAEDVIVPTLAVAPRPVHHPAVAAVRAEAAVDLVARRELER